MANESFDWVWESTLRNVEESGAGAKPSEALKPLMLELYVEACKRPVDESRLEAALVQLLRFLDSDAGGAIDNFAVTCSFIMPGDEFWEEDWAELPERFVDTLGIMAHELLQAAEDPEWADSFGGTPKQILDELSGKGQSAGRLSQN